MSANFFLDTNILVYSFDHNAPLKQAKARELIHHALSSTEGLISYQVIQEFLNVATRKFYPPLNPEDASTYLKKVLMPLARVFPTEELYQSSLDIADQWKYSFYDSLIIASAIIAGCGKLYTEDLHHGQVIEGVEIINPF